MKIDPKIKELLGYGPKEPDKKVLADWKARASVVCKPCWELNYCPYGPWVEDSPLLPVSLDEALEHQEYLKKCLATGKLGNGKDVDEARRALMQKMVDGFDPEDYPKNAEVPKEIEEMACSIFGHICPVVFICEGFTETMKARRKGRHIPFPIRTRVVRRDNSTCQICKKLLVDDEIVFDHIIPLSKGGVTEEKNLRVTCSSCNRSKSDRVEF